MTALDPIKLMFIHIVLTAIKATGARQATVTLSTMYSGTPEAAGDEAVAVTAAARLTAARRLVSSLAV